nr:immunoglobulin heavy chain junction region [Macaca mulatta]MOY22311.1 immunoglobulin heavy chain junction region [Macaca mulatta]MOY22645.1 immunoglobulin heavy chain junction region [Macaca mulatta]MOY23205.1 immunoglobulin heavy chain junction region [Macaca mulatta]MOY23598.1 immunoglobulin heavy chain junction region [Macaca mulatta]
CAIYSASYRNSLDVW